MARINTSINALQANKNMARANRNLRNTMERLSTGLRINSGKDDPAGLIGANYIDSDIKATEQGIINSERGNLVIQTADSYLSKIRERLDDMRRLVNEAANAISMSEEQINANQLVIDASIQAIDRIAKTANFQGTKLFDGSMDYSLDEDTSGNFQNITDIQVQQANLDVYDGQDVFISVTEAAERAKVTFDARAATTVAGGSEAFTMENIQKLTAETKFQFGNELLNNAAMELTGNHYGGTTSANLQIEFASYAGSTAVDPDAMWIDYAGNISDFGLPPTETSFEDGNYAIRLELTADNDFLFTIGYNNEVDAVQLDIDTLAVKMQKMLDAINDGTVTVPVGANTVMESLNISLIEGSGERYTTSISGVAGTGATADAELGADTAGNATTKASTDFGNQQYIGYEGRAEVGLGHAARFEASEFWVPTTTSGTIPNTPEYLQENESVILKKTTGDPIEVEINIFKEGTIGYEEGVERRPNGLYIITVDSARIGDNVSDTATGIQNVITNSGYKEEIYATFENKSGDALLSYSNPDGLGNGSAVVNKSAGRVSDEDYLTLQGLNGGEDVNQVAVALQFGSADGVGYNAREKKIVITLTEDLPNAAKTLGPDWDELTQDLQGLGVIQGINFSEANFKGLTQTTDNLGITSMKNYETEGSTGTSGGYVLRGSTSFEINGDYGMEVITLGEGATRADVTNAINLVAESTGVEARIGDSTRIKPDGTNLGEKDSDIYLQNFEYGSNKSITINMIEDNGHFNINLDSHYEAGKDAIATINGFESVGYGNLLRVSNSVIQAEIRVQAGTAESSFFNIRAGGGAKFQLGSQVMKSQQANISLGSMSSGKLGNAEVGYLYQLQTGGDFDLWTNKEQGAKIIMAAGAYVDSLSGRLGAFQEATLMTNIFSQTDAVINMKDSVSYYRDANYAEESTLLSKNQVLSQANNSVLSMANQQAQQVLQLIQ